MTTQTHTAHSRSRRLVSMLAVVLTLCLTTLAAVANQTTGRNVNVIEFGDSIHALGVFRQIAPGRWVEQNAAGQTVFKFRETHRDDWSVYLHDSSRNVRLQLDMHRRTVGYSQHNGPMRDLYEIRSGLSKLSGWLVKKVIYDAPTHTGTFINSSGKTWKEMNLSKKAPQFRFQELARDDWSVYLYDSSRDVHIQLDLHTGKILYNQGSSPRRELYSIARVL